DAELRQALHTERLHRTAGRSATGQIEHRQESNEHNHPHASPGRRVVKNLDTGLDRLLDRTIVPGYSSLGYHVRRRQWASDDPSPDALVARRALVTGAGSGIGEATALGLARLGATVH